MPASASGVNTAGAAAGVAGLGAWSALLALLVGFVVADGPRTDRLLSYPAAPRGPVVDVYHGMPVPDPWRWLEDLGSPETRGWTLAQNELTESYIAGLPGREQFATRLRSLLDYERRGVPDRENGVYVYPWNPGGAEQDALRVTRDLRQPGTVLLDPANVSADGTISIADFKLSPDGSRLAYALSDGGSDWKSWRVRDVATGADLPEILSGTKFTTVSWSRDGRGFYYSRYPAKVDGAGSGGHDDGRQVAVHFHVAGTPQSEDPLVHAITDHPTRDPYATVTPDGRFLILNIEDGYLSNAVYYQRLGQDEATSPVVKLLDAWDARYDFLGADGDSFYFLTTNDAPRGRVICHRPGRAGSGPVARGRAPGG